MTNVIARVSGSALSERWSTLAVMNKAPFAWNSRLDGSISRICSGVGMAMPVAASTSAFSSTDGWKTSSQTSAGGGVGATVLSGEDTTAPPSWP